MDDHTSRVGRSIPVGYAMPVLLANRVLRASRDMLVGQEPRAAHAPVAYGPRELHTGWTRLGETG